MNHMRELLEQNLLSKSANILDNISDFKNISSIRGKDLMIVGHLLEIFLHRVFRTFPHHDFQYDWSYLCLFTHCVRHHKMKNINDSLIEIENTHNNIKNHCVLNRKKFVKIMMCLVNIVDAVLSELDEVSISLEIATDLDIPVLQKALPGNVLQTLNSLITATQALL